MTLSFGTRHILALALWCYSAEALTWRFDACSAGNSNQRVAKPLVFPKSSTQPAATAALRACMLTCVMMEPQCEAVAYRITDDSCARLPAGFLAANASDGIVLWKTDSNSEYVTPLQVSASATTTPALVSSNTMTAVTDQLRIRAKDNNSSLAGLDDATTSTSSELFLAAEAAYNATLRSTSVEVATSSSVNVQESSTVMPSIVTSTHELLSVPALESHVPAYATEDTNVSSQDSAIHMTNGSSEVHSTSSFWLSSAIFTNAVTSTSATITTSTKNTDTPITGANNVSGSTSKTSTTLSSVGDLIQTSITSTAVAPSKNVTETLPVVDCRSMRNVSYGAGKGVIELRKVVTQPVRMKSVTTNEIGVWTIGDDQTLYLLKSPTNSCISEKWAWQRIDGIKWVKNVTFWNESVYVYTTKEFLYAHQSAAFSGAGCAGCAANSTWTLIPRSINPINLEVWSSNGLQGYYGIPFKDNKLGYTNSGQFSECHSTSGNSVISLAFGQAGLWIVDSQGAVMQSKGTYPSNTDCSQSWNSLENDGFHSTATAADEVLLLASNGTCFVRYGVRSSSAFGDGWLAASSTLSTASMSPSNVIWGLDSNGTLFSSLV